MARLSMIWGPGKHLEGMYLGMVYRFFAPHKTVDRVPLIVVATRKLLVTDNKEWANMIKSKLMSLSLLPEEVLPAIIDPTQNRCFLLKEQMDPDQDTDFSLITKIEYDAFLDARPDERPFDLAHR